MNRKLFVAVVSGALALPLAASVQADATVYGSLRYGVEMADTDKAGSDSTWDLGSNRGSRFGIKGSVEAGEGLTAGFQIERNLNAGLTARHHNVSLSGAFGTFKFGRQGAPYYSATTWDGSQTLGGITDFSAIGGASRASGVSYASNLGGPFSFHVLLGSADGGADGSGDGADHVNAGASLAAGPVNISVGYRDDKDASERIGGAVGGNVASINWKVGADTGTDSCGADCDDDRFGFHVGYALGSGNAYMQFSDLDSDNDMKDTNGWVFGYAHALSDNVMVYAEYGTTDSMDDDGELTSTTTVVALKVGF